MNSPFLGFSHVLSSERDGATHSHFIDKEIEAQREKPTQPSAQQWQMVLESELEGRSLAARPGLRAPLEGQDRVVQPMSLLT